MDDLLAAQRVPNILNLVIQVQMSFQCPDLKLNRYLVTILNSLRKMMIVY